MREWQRTMIGMGNKTEDLWETHGTSEKVRMATEKQQRDGQEGLPTTRKQAGASEKRGTLVYASSPHHHAPTIVMERGWPHHRAGSMTNHAS
jgi:hypothetical protein